MLPITPVRRPILPNPKKPLDILDEFHYTSEMKSVIFQDGVAHFHFSEEKSVVVYSLVRLLNFDVILKEGTTLRHIWQYIEHDAKVFEHIFWGALGQFALDDFVKQAQVEPTEKDEEEEDPIKFLELFWEASLWRKQFDLSSTFRGVGSDGTKYALEFTLINELLDYPLVLTNEFELKEKTDRKNIIKTPAKKGWTVYDMIYGILYEISFVGPPRQQIARLAELDQRLAEGKESIEEE